MAGYTNSRIKSPGPDFELLQQICRLEAPAILEGRVETRLEA